MCPIVIILKKAVSVFSPSLKANCVKLRTLRVARRKIYPAQLFISDGLF